MILRRPNVENSVYFKVGKLSLYLKVMKFISALYVLVCCT